MPSTILIKGHKFTGPASGLVPNDGTLIVDPDTNLLKIGESSWRVHNSGSLALDNISGL